MAKVFKQLNLRFPADERDLIESEAKRRGICMMDLIRAALRAYMEHGTEKDLGKRGA